MCAVRVEPGINLVQVVSDSAAFPATDQAEAWPVIARQQLAVTPLACLLQKLRAFRVGSQLFFQQLAYFRFDIECFRQAAVMNITNQLFGMGIGLVAEFDNG